MIMIPPQERYNQHANSGDISPHLMEKAISRYGFNQSHTMFRKLHGGFQNANYLVEEGDKKRVFRFYSTGVETARREVGFLGYLQGKGVMTPKVLHFFEIEGKSIVVLEFLSGDLLQDRLLTPSSVDISLFYRIGQVLANIHQIDLPRPGFIDSEMNIGNEYENFGLFIREYIKRVLNTVDEKRLEKTVVKRIENLIQEKWYVVLETEPTHQLVHGDFNPKNILVSTGNDSRVTGVLDFEFCLSGNGYLDIGNFFRFSADYPEGASEAFIQGYEQVRGTVHPKWREVSCLLDLANMCSFLERDEDYQKTFRTARTVIEDTLAFFGY